MLRLAISCVLLLVIILYVERMWHYFTIADAHLHIVA